MIDPICIPLLILDVFLLQLDIPVFDVSTGHSIQQIRSGILEMSLQPLESSIFIISISPCAIKGIQVGEGVKRTRLGKRRDVVRRVLHGNVSHDEYFGQRARWKRVIYVSAGNERKMGCALEMVGE
jgi:hypothetical protein